ncbi:MAG: toxin-antitoxin system YwqK family antitoxin [Bacteroidetes bacterium]|nr:toxin-antitoxin system YwqK family antitoxin [Bacteroidota bacterium]
MNRIFLFFILVSLLAACKGPANDQAEQTTAKDTVAIDNPMLKPPTDPFQKNGEEKTKYSNGVLRTQGNYRNGKRDGQWYSWYSTGKPWSETYFENGIKNGPTKTWFESGKLRYEGQFTNDVKTGTWKYYDENGNLAKVIDHTGK